MALQYGLNNAVDFESSKIMMFASIYSRTMGQPMDKTQLWYPLDGKSGLERAQEYAASTSAYVGQEIAVVDVTYEEDGTTVKGTSVTFYGIQDAAGTLKELGSKPVGDGKSIDVAADGTVSIHGFGDLTNDQVGYLPRIKKVVDIAAAEGVEEVSHLEIEWVPVSDVVKGDGNSVTTVTNADASVNVTDDAEEGFEGHKYKVRANISAAEGNELELKDDGLFVAVPVPEYTIKKTAPAEGTYITTYDLQKDGENVAEQIAVTDYSVSVVTNDITDDSVAKHYKFYQLGKEIAHIDIPKDMIIKSGTVGTVTEADKPYEGAIIGDKYIDLVLNITGGEEQHLYIEAKDLVDIYTAEDTDSVDMTVDGTAISATIKISAKEGNALAVLTGEGEKGLYVAPPTIPAIVAEDSNSIDFTVSGDDGHTITAKVKLASGVLNNNAISEFDDGLFVAPQIANIVAPGSTEETSTDTIDVIKALETTSTYGTIFVPTKASVVTPTGLDKAIAASKKVNQYQYTYNDTTKEWTQSTVEVSLPTALVPARVDKNAAGDITGGIAGLLTPEEKNKLAALVIGEGGGVEISGTINADNVVGLVSKVAETVTGSGEGQLAIEAGAQVNKIEGISLPDAVLAIDEHKTISVPYADKEVVDGITTRTSGVVKGSDGENKIDFVDGVGEVNSLNVNKLVQTAGDILILDGGTATTNIGG